MQNVIFLPFAIVLFFLFRMMFKRAVFYHAGRKEWITDIRWYYYAMYYALMAFFTGCLLIPFFPETVMQIGRFYALHHGRSFVSVQGDNDKELHELRKGLPDGEEMFKYEVLSSVTPTEIVDEIIPETIEYQRKLKQMWVDMGVYSAVPYDFDKEFEIHYDIDNKNYYILADDFLRRFASERASDKLEALFFIFIGGKEMSLMEKILNLNTPSGINVQTHLLSVKYRMGHFLWNVLRNI